MMAPRSKKTSKGNEMRELNEAEKRVLKLADELFAEFSKLKPMDFRDRENVALDLQRIKAHITCRAVIYDEERSVLDRAKESDAELATASAQDAAYANPRAITPRY